MVTTRKVADRVVMLYPLSRLGPAERQILSDGPPQAIERGPDGLTLSLAPGAAFKSGKPPVDVAGVLRLGDKAVELNPAMKAGLAASSFAPALVAGPVKANVVSMAYAARSIATFSSTVLSMSSVKYTRRRSACWMKSPG